MILLHWKHKCAGFKVHKSSQSRWKLFAWSASETPNPECTSHNLLWFLVWRKWKMHFLISVCRDRSMPCWKNICTTALVCGWLLYREWYFTYEVIPLQLSPQPSPLCTHSLTPIQPHTHTHTQNHLNTVLHKHVQISSNGCSSKTQTWTQTHSTQKQVILEMTWYAKLHICSRILPSCHVKYDLTLGCLIPMNDILTLLSVE